MKYKLNGDLKYSLNLSSGPALSLRINKKGPSLRAQKLARRILIFGLHQHQLLILKK